MRYFPTCFARTNFSLPPTNTIDMHPQDTVQLQVQWQDLFDQSIMIRA